MTREDVIEILARFVIGAKPCSQREIIDACASAYGMLKEQPSIPSNINEAAEEYFLKTYGIDNMAISEDIKRAVKFGAEWIAGQGVTEVSRLYRDPNPPHEGLFFGVLPFFSTIQMALNYQDGEEVIVQIRKKQ